MSALHSLRLMSAFIRVSVVVTVMLGAVVSSWGSEPEPRQRETDVANLPKCFPVLARLSVRAYRNQDWCKNIWYQRGKFSQQTDSADSCNLFEGTPQPFDAQALQDFDSIARALTATGVRLYCLSDLRYGPDGTLAQAKFHLAGGRYTYVYSPGYKALPEDIPEERKHARINADWFYVWEDWN